LRSGNTQVFLLHGNRDLLMGKILADACGAKLLHDPTLIDLHGTPTLLSHGDTLCTDDIEYQNFRTQVHDTEFQKSFLLNHWQRVKRASPQLHKLSTEAKGKKTVSSWMSTIPRLRVIARVSLSALIHGHTHRPPDTNIWLTAINVNAGYWENWYQHGSALRCDAQGVTPSPF